MKNVRYQRLIRLGTRGLELTQAPNPALAVGLLNEPLLAAHQGMQKCLDTLRDMDLLVSAKTSKSRGALEVLRKQFDNARIVVASAHIQAPLFCASSQYRVPEDQLESARQLLGMIVNEQQTWAQQILPVLTSALDQATQSRAEELSSRASLQKARSQALEQADNLESVLISLRTAVRAVFGSTSRECQMIRAFQPHADSVEPQAPIVELTTSKDNSIGQKVA